VDEIVSVGLTASVVHQLRDFLSIFALQVKAVGDVIANSAREENGLLLNNGDLVMVPLGVELLDVVSVEKNFTRSGVVESFNERNYGGLSTATCAAESHYAVLYIINGEGHALKHLDVRLARVTKLDVPELEATVQLTFNRISAFLVDHDLGLHNLDELVRGAHDLGYVTEGVGDHSKVLNKHQHVEKEG